MNNPRNNKTADEKRHNPWETEEYVYALAFWRDAPHAVASAGVLYFRDPTDRSSFSTLFQDMGYQTREGL